MEGGREGWGETGVWRKTMGSGYFEVKRSGVGGVKGGSQDRERGGGISVHRNGEGD